IPPGNILVARNICVGGQWTEIYWGATPDMITFEANLVNGDPQFVDPANGNFELKETSPAFKLGFQRIPVEKIGLVRNARQAAGVVTREPGTNNG
ncbi:MAG: hypothetical protein HYV36_06935, partial [Lentisphaerae bacterium]|nr:hypothetical protein [Lentisphaerota bacterium]